MNRMNPAGTQNQILALGLQRYVQNVCSFLSLYEEYLLDQIVRFLTGAELYGLLSTTFHEQMQGVFGWCSSHL